MQNEIQNELEPHLHEDDPRLIMGPVPPEVLKGIRQRHQGLRGNSFTRRDAVRLMSIAGLAGLAGCGTGGVAPTTISSSSASTSTSSSSSSSSTSSSTGTSTTSSSSDTTTCTQGVSTTEGPYWVDGDTATPQRSDIRSDTKGTSSSQNGYNGVALALSFAVYSYSANGCTPLQNARVDIWHCDAQGIYSDETSQAETSLNYSDDNFLRGYQLTDSSGLVSFTTIFPGWYTGRTTHIHVRIRTYDTSGNVAVNSTTQVFFDDALVSSIYSNSSYYTRSKTRDTYNSNDSIYKAQLLMSASGSISAGYSNTLYGIGLPFGS